MNYIYVDEKSINPFLICGICSRPYVDPVITRDNTRFCRSCIVQRATLVNMAEEAPGPSFVVSIVPIGEQIIHDMLDNLLVKCPDCQELNLRRKDLETHLLNECQKRIVQCKASDLRCPWSGHYDESAEHTAACTFELLRPILSERCQHGTELEEYRRLVEGQRSEIEQLRKQVEECKAHNERLQKGFRTFWEVNSQQRQKCEKFQDDIQHDITEETLRRNQLRDDFEHLREQLQQMNVLYEEIKENSSQPNQTLSQEMENIRQQLDQIKINQDNQNQAKESQQKESIRPDELSRIRQMCNQHEIQIGLLARKKCVVPIRTTSVITSVSSKLQGLVETCRPYSDIDLDGKHYDNQDMEFVCKTAIVDKQCRKLRLENNDITAKGVTILADTLYGNTSLEELHLSNNSISDIGAHALAQVLAINNFTLTWLEIHANHITDDGAEYLAEMLKTNKTLILLGLSFNQIGDRGVQYLTNSIAHYNKTLQWLYLASNKAITDTSVDYVRDMFRGDQPVQLKALFLNDCSLTTEGANALKKIVKGNANFILDV